MSRGAAKTQRHKGLEILFIGPIMTYRTYKTYNKKIALVL